MDIDSDLATRLFRGEIDHYEMAKRYVRKDRSIVRILLTVSIARAKNGRILCAISKIQPITQLPPGTTLPSFQHDDEPNDQIERIKNAMFW